MDEGAPKKRTSLEIRDDILKVVKEERSIENEISILEAKLAILKERHDALNTESLQDFSHEKNL